ncbi:site-2 protease family protein [Ruixingdingia sedimenti]|uniref:Zinc metalloprotease n=1 Tax=Ruixingdingia sedimenti TaxID=3073604 RepID=A0ABU1F3Q3_9RHOB|nr:site-2 protease family protein [Xinfangfangia sp. LG-4]MDR5651278.1 site-2 protease family protein [Xinfangfangia sp. LG-4]
MGWSFPIGRLFGSELRVHATFLLLIGWIGVATWMAEGPAAAAENVAFILALFACVVAHEFGHALMARRYGIATPDITLLPIGGLARLERMPEDPRQEIAVALAGPAVSVLIWAVLALAAGSGLGALAEIERTGAGFVARLAGVNLFLALFNLLPAFPMDGGRVLRAALAMRLPRARATRVAATAGQVLAFLFGVAGFASGNVMLMLIAVFVWFAANAENADVAMREATRGLLARDAAITVFEPLSPGDTLDAAAHALIRTTQHEFPVLGPDGRLEGFLTRQALARALASGARGDPVSGAMLREVPAVALDARLDRVLAALQTAPAVAVTDAAGRFIGYVTPDNLGELMMLRGRG